MSEKNDNDKVPSNDSSLDVLPKEIPEQDVANNTSSTEDIPTKDNISKNETESSITRESNEVKKLLDQLTEKENQYNQLYDRFLRLMADYDNLKKRTQQEKIRLIKNANKDLLANLLDFIDSFEKLYQHSQDDNVTVEVLKESIHTIYSQLWKILKESGLNKLEVIGKSFDPNYHEVVFVKKDENVPEDTILEEVQPGFLINDELLRASKVVVSKKE